MQIKKKDMQNSNWSRLLEKQYISEEISINGIDGVVSLTIMNKVTEPLEVNAPMGKIMIANENYKWLQLALKNQNFWLTAMYDDSDNLIEVYFDITDNNYFDDITNPYCYDLFTDIVLTKDNVYIVDEDELEMAYSKKVVSEEQYQKVKDVTKELYDYIVSNREEIIEYCCSKRNELQKKLNLKRK